MIIWFAFYASDYVVEKNIAIILLSIFITVLLLGGIWALWGLKMIPKEGKEIMETIGFKWRIWTSIIIPIIALIFLIIWFWYYAEPFTIWQHIAVLLVTLLIVGGILGVVWTRWGMTHGWKMQKQAAF